jgi:hypothetical protein
MKAYVFLTSALAGAEWSASRSCRFTPEERAPDTHWTGGWATPRAGLDDVEKRKFLTLPGFELRTLGHPARNQSLYRLRYPGSNFNAKRMKRREGDKGKKVVTNEGTSMLNF